MSTACPDPAPTNVSRGGRVSPSSEDVDAETVLGKPALNDASATPYLRSQTCSSRDNFPDVDIVDAANT